MSGAMARLGPRKNPGREPGDPTIYRPKPLESEEKTRFILDRPLAKCGRQLAQLQPRTRNSAWTDYLDHKSLYTSAQLQQKDRFVREALELAKTHRVLDVGANEGRFSFMAAEQKASVSSD